jgi:hypothetical protein
MVFQELITVLCSGIVMFQQTIYLQMDRFRATHKNQVIVSLSIDLSWPKISGKLLFIPMVLAGIVHEIRCQTPYVAMTSFFWTAYII